MIEHVARLQVNIAFPNTTRIGGDTKDELAGNLRHRRGNGHRPNEAGQKAFATDVARHSAKCLSTIYSWPSRWIAIGELLV
ncbi:hypothetical protein LRP30_06080 [Bradyrhizobium sp. C-145]|uniref:hypothetical protein n=1 Tax=Bradyrhizobium sp. C-145 TaxID=574727 RepID=UPI00201B79BC|nr:hypothetical protein [Bradyrhizobium sp. C-145]UQR64868.1 hypothetical protein LRP30_06080 [Bradyrhizobium sp. C-145]